MTTTADTAHGELAATVLELIRRVGLKEVTDILEVSTTELHGMLMGQTQFPEDAVVNINRLVGVLDAGRQTVGIGDGLRTDALTDTVEMEPTEEEIAMVPDAVVRRESAASGGKGVVNQLMDDLYRTRLMALRHQVDLTLREDERISRQLLVVQIELTLILYFEESVPEPGLGWTALKRNEESEKRLRRQRHLSAELERYNKGFVGLVRRVIGRRSQTPRELMAEMMEEADRLHSVGEKEAETSRDLLERVLQPTGLDPDMVREVMQQREEVAV